jgi:hypothetical protein
MPIYLNKTGRNSGGETKWHKKKKKLLKTSQVVQDSMAIQTQVYIRVRVQ